jgi:hypothetical protein
LVAIRVLFSFLKGSGSLELVGRDPASGRVGTAQSAPSSSTPAASGTSGSAASAVTTVTAPATESATATTSATTVERIFERPELRITKALLRAGKL